MTLILTEMLSFTCRKIKSFLLFTVNFLRLQPLLKITRLEGAHSRAKSVDLIEVPFGYLTKDTCNKVLWMAKED